jgi:prepilin-type N-terminal cleavage/methylation domain-containing protein
MDAVKRRLRLARRDGFTLIEVMIVVGILSFGLMSLSAMQLHAMRGGNRGRHSTQATAIAEGQMEQLIRTTWTALAPTGGWTAATTVNNTVQADAGNGAEQSYSMSFRIANATAGSTRNVDVRVSWVETGGQARSVSLSSIRFNRENL